MGVFNSKMGITEKIVTELENRAIKIIQFEEQRKKRLKKHEQSFRHCGTIIKDLTFLSLKSLNKGSKR